MSKRRRLTKAVGIGEGEWTKLMYLSLKSGETLSTVLHEILAAHFDSGTCDFPAEVVAAAERCAERELPRKSDNRLESFLAALRQNA